MFDSRVMVAGSRVVVELPAFSLVTPRADSFAFAMGVGYREKTGGKPRKLLRTRTPVTCRYLCCFSFHDIHVGSHGVYNSMAAGACLLLFRWRESASSRELP